MTEQATKLADAIESCVTSINSELDFVHTGKQSFLVEQGLLDPHTIEAALANIRQHADTIEHLIAKHNGELPAVGYTEQLS
jgi:hypothetical protein